MSVCGARTEWLGTKSSACDMVMDANDWKDLGSEASVSGISGHIVFATGLTDF